MSQQTKIVAILLAAGGSTRMNGVDKIVVPLHGRPLLEYSLERLAKSESIDSIVIVTGHSNAKAVQDIAMQTPTDKITTVCTGGMRRQDSVRAGLEHVRDATHILVHDGARPLIDAPLIARAVQTMSDHRAAIAAVPVKDTIKMAGDNMTVLETVPRNSLWSVQTPQIFEADLLRAAHCSIHADVTDDASMVEMLGHEVKLFMGSYENLKVTTPEDIVMVEAILRSRSKVVAQ
ncbi:MAG: 2-C-methyl-D-erythritol 4-phosphate cytidylyltransferase [Chloroflexota bacterium]|nr:2-C-methyl-D-erythritol 4-phosphate cytidylyltransferase [Chloroflexota bacterium]